jgi:MFS family permease
MTTTYPKASASPHSPGELLSGANAILESSSAKSWYVVFVLTLANIFSGIDRHIMTVMVGPIRKEFLISDTQFSLLQGAAFTLVYCLAAYPLGRLADRVNRSTLLTCGITLWSLMTIYSGFAGSYQAMLCARIGVGIGEAVLIPAALSLIADYFKPAQRGRPIGIFSSATFLGTGIALLAGGFALAMLKNLPSVDVPFIGPMAVWRSVFLTVGIPGLAIALILSLTIKDPRSKMGVAMNQQAKNSGSMKQFVSFLTASRKLFVSIYGISGLFTFVAFSVGPWLPTMLVRKFSMVPSQAGITVGLSVTICGTIGATLAGLLCDRWTKAGNRGHKLGVLKTSFFLMIPAILGFTLAPTSEMAIGFIMLFAFSNAAGFAAVAASLQDIVPNNFRGQASAILLIVNGIIGFTLGTTAVALITDYVFHNDASVGYSILVAALPAAIICLLWIWATLNDYDRAYKAMRNESAMPAAAAKAATAH